MISVIPSFFDFHFALPKIKFAFRIFLRYAEKSVAANLEEVPKLTGHPRPGDLIAPEKY